MDETKDTNVKKEDIKDTKCNVEIGDTKDTNIKIEDSKDTHGKMEGDKDTIVKIEVNEDANAKIKDSKVNDKEISPGDNCAEYGGGIGDIPTEPVKSPGRYQDDDISHIQDKSINEPAKSDENRNNNHNHDSNQLDNSSIEPIGTDVKGEQNSVKQEEDLVNSGTDQAASAEQLTNSNTNSDSQPVQHEEKVQAPGFPVLNINSSATLEGLLSSNRQALNGVLNNNSIALSEVIQTENTKDKVTNHSNSENSSNKPESFSVQESELKETDKVINNGVQKSELGETDKAVSDHNKDSSSSGEKPTVVSLEVDKTSQKDKNMDQQPGPSKEPEPNSKAPEPDSKESESDNKEPNPDNKEPESDNKEPVPDNKEPEPDNKEPEPDSKERKPDSKESELDNKEPEPDNKEPEPDNKEPEPDSKERKPDSKEPKPDNKEPKPDSKEPDPEIKQPEPENKEPEPDNKEPEPDIKEPKPDKNIYRSRRDRIRTQFNLGQSNGTTNIHDVINILKKDKEYLTHDKESVESWKRLKQYIYERKQAEAVLGKQATQAQPISREPTSTSLSSAASNNSHNLERKQAEAAPNKQAILAQPISREPTSTSLSSSASNNSHNLDQDELMLFRYLLFLRLEEKRKEMAKQQEEAKQNLPQEVPNKREDEAGEENEEVNKAEDSITVKASGDTEEATDDADADKDLTSDTSSSKQNESLSELITDLKSERNKMVENENLVKNRPINVIKSLRRKSLESSDLNLLHSLAKLNIKDKELREKENSIQEEEREQVEEQRQEEKDKENKKEKMLDYFCLLQEKTNEAKTQQQQESKVEDETNKTAETPQPETLIAEKADIPKQEKEDTPIEEISSTENEDKTRLMSYLSLLQMKANEEKEKEKESKKLFKSSSKGRLKRLQTVIEELKRENSGLDGEIDESDLRLFKYLAILQVKAKLDSHNDIPEEPEKEEKAKQKEDVTKAKQKEDVTKAKQKEDVTKAKPTPVKKKPPTPRPKPKPEKKKSDLFSKALLDELARNALREAADSGEKDRLEQAILDYIHCDVKIIDKEDQALQYAMGKLDFLKTRDSLHDAIEQRDALRLQYNLDYCENVNYRSHLTRDLKRAKTIIVEDIDEDTPTTKDVHKKASEIRRYQQAHPITRIVTKATLLMLNEPEAKTKKWKKCQALMTPLGSQGLVRKTKTFQVDCLHSQIVARAKELLSKVTPEEVAEASECTDILYKWDVSMIKEYEARHGTVEDVKPASKRHQKRIIKTYADEETENKDIYKPLVLPMLDFIHGGRRRSLATVATAVIQQQKQEKKEVAPGIQKWNSLSNIMLTTGRSPLEPLNLKGKDSDNSRKGKADDNVGRSPLEPLNLKGKDSDNSRKGKADDNSRKGKADDNSRKGKADDNVVKTLPSGKGNLSKRKSISVDQNPMSKSATSTPTSMRSRTPQKGVVVATGGGKGDKSGGGGGGMLPKIENKPLIQTK